MYKIYKKLKCRKIRALINTVHTGTLQATYILNRSLQGTVVQKITFDSFTPLQL
jgi:hypothetical protein